VESLFRALRPLKDFILFHIDEEEIAMENKIVAAILLFVYRNQFLLTTCHNITSSIDFKTNSFFELQHRTGSGVYLCLIINKILRDE
jgi:hypothetical protein